MLGADAKRDRRLALLGWRVARLPEALVIGDIEAAVAYVAASLADTR